MSELISDTLKIIIMADEDTNYIKFGYDAPFSFLYINNYNENPKIKDTITYCEKLDYKNIFKLFLAAVNDCIAYEYKSNDDKYLNDVDISSRIFFNHLINLGIIYHHFTKDLTFETKPLLVPFHELKNVYDYNNGANLIERDFNNWILRALSFSLKYSDWTFLIKDFNKVIGWLISHCLNNICGNPNNKLIEIYDHFRNSCSEGLKRGVFERFYK